MQQMLLFSLLAALWPCSGISERVKPEILCDFVHSGWVCSVLLLSGSSLCRQPEEPGKGCPTRSILSPILSLCNLCYPSQYISVGNRFYLAHLWDNSWVVLQCETIVHTCFKWNLVMLLSFCIVKDLRILKTNYLFRFLKISFKIIESITISELLVRSILLT